jgi:pimeloyl-ACP methyl ester carboxylesterase
MTGGRRTTRVTVPDGVELAVHEWGRGNGAAVVLLHGGGLSSDEWTDLAPQLAERRRVVAFDARGCGASDRDPERRYGVRTIAADLERVCSACGLRAFALVGHSFGAVAACVYAAEHPDAVTSLVLVDGGPADRTRPSSLEDPPRAFATRADAARSLSRLLPRGFPDWYLDSRFETLGDGSLVWRSDIDGRVAWAHAGGEPLVPRLWPFVEALQTPTIVLHGDESPLFPRETAVRMTGLNPRVRLVDVPRAGHFVHLDRPDAVLAAIEELA